MKDKVMLKPTDFFDLNDFEHKLIFDTCEYVWVVLPKIGQYILQYFMLNDCVQYNSKDFRKIDFMSFFGNRNEYILPDSFADNTKKIFIGKGTIIEPGAYIQGPAIIGERCQIRSGAYIRENVIVGNDCIIGHTSEMKNVIMLNKAKAPHFNYCGDSVLGNGVNLGCGTVLSNLPLTSEKDPVTGTRDTIKLDIDGKITDTKLSKFGAILGDGTQTGCNSTLNPGTLLGKNCIVYPNLSVRKGFYEDNKILKN